MRALVTGGAGYIGSHAVRALAARGHEPVVFDNLSRGHREAVIDAPIIVGDLLSPGDTAQAIASSRAEAVLHFAGLTYVGESVGHPDVYYRNNVAGTMNLLDAMREHRVGTIIFSSTAAVYGDPVRLPIDEDHPLAPVSPYGRSKLMVEWMLRDRAASLGLRYVALRYFNAAGSSLDGRIGEDHEPETHLIPRVLLAAAGELPELTILGTDWDTPDGTCIRDYIHVEDLAEAHVLALDHLAGGGRSASWNLGTGKGCSVREVIACAEKVTGRKVPLVEGGRRAGDPAVLVAAADRIQRELGWRPRHLDLEAIVASAWRWVERGGRYARLAAARGAGR
ncbi:MAG: UDP-glucose 4-epimerase GalE [Planctomycetes bacterium]|nr:UDP-glucose 4-epimerase GalE [Planctomycetota bacterium]